MNHGEEIKKRTNPKQKANVLSSITFFFIFELLRKGFKKDVTEDDIYEVLPKFKASKVGNTLEKEFLAEKSQKKRVSSYRLLWNSYGRYYLLLGFVQLAMKTIMIVILPSTKGKLISYFQPNTKLSKSDAIYYAGVMIGLNIVICTYNHNYMFLLVELGLKIKTAFCSLIYRKCLKLESTSLSKNGIGKIITLISKDVNSFENVVIFLNDVWISLIVFVMASCIMYSKIGAAALPGLSLLVIVLPLQVYLGKLTSQYRLEAAKATDKRLQVCQETLSSIKLVKMYKWEDYFCQQMLRSRKEEMKKIKQFYYARSIFTELGTFVVTLTWYILITTYTRLGNTLTAEIVFFLRGCLRALESPMTRSIPLGILRSAEMVSSVQRIDNLLNDKEHDELAQIANTDGESYVRMKNVNIKRNDFVLDDINLRFGPGVNIIAGKNGSGKTLLLKVIMGNLSHTGELETKGIISYASQEPWLFPSSIKQNILFGQEFNEKRYRKVLEVCALEADLSTFKKGDETIVDDGGRNLSKGQQIRINLARAVYNDSDIYLLDDCLSSLDVHLQEYVFTQCVKNFLKEKVVVVVSNNQRFFERSDNTYMIVDSTVKRLQSSESKPQTIDDLLTEHVIIGSDLEGESNEMSEISKLVEKKMSQNIYHEEPKKGKVAFDVYKRYCNFGGGILMLVWIFLLYISTQTGRAYSDKSVSKWVNIQQNIHSTTTNATRIQQLLEDDRAELKFYTLAIAFYAVFLSVRIISFFSFIAKGATALHKSMVLSVFYAKMKFFDTRYFGNILNRFAKDMYTIDEILPFNINECVKFACSLITAVSLIASVNVSFLIPISIFCVTIFFMRFFYIRTGRSIIRLDSATRSPVIGHLNATLEGLPTIRVSGTQDILKKEFDRHQDLHTSAVYMEKSASRCFAYTLDMLCNFFSAAIVVRFLIFDKDTQAGSVGLAITQALSLQGSLQWGIRQWANLETNMTSVERVLEYTDVEKENRVGRVLDTLCSYAKLSYQAVYLEYGNSFGYTLKNINFVIKPGEKIGIVGRTGAGKSSLISILFKLYQYEGTISINDVDITTISLDFLRSNIVFISQDPVLFNGTIRANIDPTRRYTDEEIWHAISATNLKELIPILDQEIVDKSTLSCGQKQLICLVRALVSRSRIVVLDEATANVDPETDAVISKTLRESFEGCTVLMVAHKLESVLKFDRVMVIDKGEIVEFDEPDVLLRNDNGVFYRMVLKAELLK